MGGGVGAAVQESKENQGSGDDLHRMEYLEEEESASLQSKVYLTIRGAAGDQEWDHGKEVGLWGARVIFLWLMFSCFHLEFEFFNYVILVL